MKKLIILCGILLIGITVLGQKPSIFKPIPKNIFAKEITADRAIQGQWLWRFAGIVTANELTWDKAEHRFVSAPLSSVGPSIGFRHLTALEDGTPYLDWGISAALLLGTDINSPTNVKAAVLLNAFSYINIGACYTFNNVNHFGILMGATINF